MKYQHLRLFHLLQRHPWYDFATSKSYGENKLEAKIWSFWVSAPEAGFLKTVRHVRTLLHFIFFDTNSDLPSCQTGLNRVLLFLQRDDFYRSWITWNEPGWMEWSISLLVCFMIPLMLDAAAIKVKHYFQDAGWDELGLSYKKKHVNMLR